jgi:hypothetical protein
VVSLGRAAEMRKVSGACLVCLGGRWKVWKMDRQHAEKTPPCKRWLLGSKAKTCQWLDGAAIGSGTEVTTVTTYASMQAGKSRPAFSASPARTLEMAWSLRHRGRAGGMPSLPPEAKRRFPHLLQLGREGKKACRHSSLASSWAPIMRLPEHSSAFGQHGCAVIPTLWCDCASLNTNKQTVATIISRRRKVGIQRAVWDCGLAQVSTLFNEHRCMYILYG